MRLSLLWDLGEIIVLLSILERLIVILKPVAHHLGGGHLPLHQRPNSYLTVI